ncbi:hypothetical protein AGR4B_pAt20243 [Agrobacterium tumefaciens str. CFBP 5621]|nr:hypothetical protein AGR4B_pAt20243 [Agrobacterium tumefaciens str. CFBP 5621]
MTPPRNLCATTPSSSSFKPRPKTALFPSALASLDPYKVAEPNNFANISQRRGVLNEQNANICHRSGSLCSFWLQPACGCC